MSAAGRQRYALELEVEFAYARRLREHREQLAAITGGMDADVFIALRTAATLRTLQVIRAGIEDYLAKNPVPPSRTQRLRTFAARLLRRAACWIEGRATKPGDA